MKAKTINNLKLLIALIIVVAVGVAIYFYANSYFIKGSMTILPTLKKATIQSEKRLLPSGDGMQGRQLPGGNGEAIPTGSRSFGDGGGGW